MASVTLSRAAMRHGRELAANAASAAVGPTLQRCGVNRVTATRASAGTHSGALRRVPAAPSTPPLPSAGSTLFAAAAAPRVIPWPPSPGMDVIKMACETRTAGHAAASAPTASTPGLSSRPPLAPGTSRPVRWARGHSQLAAASDAHDNDVQVPSSAAASAAQAAAVVAAPRSRKSWGGVSIKAPTAPPAVDERADSHTPLASRRYSARAEVVFQSVWSRLEADGCVMSFPTEVVWLNGAPGSGKGTNTEFILRARGIKAAPIVMSDLLREEAKGSASSGVESAMSNGDMIADDVAVEKLFRALLAPSAAAGVVVDGFPRTPLQVECLTLLADKMRELHAEHYCSTSPNTVAPDFSEAVAASAAAQGAMAAGAPPPRVLFPPPRFLVAILYVSEAQSISRQLNRGREAAAHNAKVRETGVGELVEERPTDADAALVSRRYSIFVRHRNTLLSLADRFPCTIIDASDSVADVQRRLVLEFATQELSARAYTTVASIPRATRVRERARPELVARLDEWERTQRPLFASTVRMISEQFIPACRRAAFAGVAVVKVSPTSEGWKELQQPLCVDLVVDILSERGYSVRHDVVSQQVPTRVDLDTGLIECTTMDTHRFVVQFPCAQINRTESLKALLGREEEVDRAYDL
ncbi:hypothetical protein MMPV_006416 [Pyropia vietnamensis]